MTLDQLSGPGIIAFSDPAGAKAALSVAALLLHSQRTETCSLFSNRHYSFFSDWSEPVTVVPVAAALPWPQSTPRWVFTGTSHPDSSAGFELDVIAEARLQGVPTVSFIDHYSNYLLRFRRHGAIILPDFIWVLDEKARSEAIADGLPAQRLVIQANPYLDYIRTLWSPRLHRADILEIIHPHDNHAFRNLWLYAPDPISLRNSGEWAFDEVAALHDLIDILKDASHTLLLVRPHPLQHLEKLESLIRAYRPERGNLVTIRSDLPGLDTASAADCIIGFHSNFLLEAAALKRPVIRYFPASPERDAFKHLNIGTLVHNANSLRSRLLQPITDIR